MEIEFGYYPLPLSLSFHGIEIRTLPNLNETALVDAEGVEANWIYAPPQEVYHMGGSGSEIQTMPFASRVFGLPKTHTLRHASAEGDDHLAFLLWTLSFFTGMRLTATEAGFVDATPIVPGKLVDFRLSEACLNKAMALAELFWHASRGEPMKAKRFAAAVHALFLAQNPRLLEFERFILLYAALDACFALAASLYP